MSKARIATAGVAAAMALATPLVVKWEGVVLRGYKDPIGVVTACIGHTKTAQLGKTYTRAECDALFRKDLAEHARDIAPCIKRELPVEVHAAMLSFAFNVGAERFCSSTAARKLNAGDYAGACAQLSRWTYAGGRQLKGLVSRRADERRLCESGL